MKPRKQPLTMVRFCRDCKHARPVTRFHTLDIQGKPTIAECQYSPERCRLLSEKACRTHFLAI